MRYKRSISPNRTTDGINNMWCFTFQLTLNTTNAISLTCSLSLSRRGHLPASDKYYVQWMFSFFFPLRACINFLLLYKVEINIQFDWQSPDLNIWFTLRPIKTPHDNDVLTASLLLLFSHLTDGQLLVRRKPRTGETQIRFKALIRGHATIFL